MTLPQFQHRRCHFLLPGSASGSPTLLLDTYPGAVAAYSLRKLRSAYSGALIRVRRSSDNAEADIGFDANGDLDTAALLAHVGAGDGFVATWYDQSGNSNDAVQTTAAKQMRVVDSGSVETNENFIGLRTTDVGDYHLFPPDIHSAKSNSWVFAAVDVLTSPYSQQALTTSDYTAAWHRSTIIDSSGKWGMLQGSTSSIDVLPGRVLITGGSENATPDCNLWINGQPAISGSSNLNDGLNFSGEETIGAGQPGENQVTINALHFEWIIFDTDQSADRSGIESAIIAAYGIS